MFVVGIAGGASALSTQHLCEENARLREMLAQAGRAAAQAGLAAAHLAGAGSPAASPPFSPSPPLGASASPGVRARQPDGTEVEYRAPITLDCTGKESFAASRNRWRVRDPELNKVAVWTYYKGAKRDNGIDEGVTTA